MARFYEGMAPFFFFFLRQEEGKKKANLRDNLFSSVSLLPLTVFRRFLRREPIDFFTQEIEDRKEFPIVYIYFPIKTS